MSFDYIFMVVFIIIFTDIVVLVLQLLFIIMTKAILCFCGAFRIMVFNVVPGVLVLLTYNLLFMITPSLPLPLISNYPH